MDIVAWLRSLGLERYEAAFRENEITEKVLPSLTAEDLKEIGVGPVGHRRILIEAIVALRFGEGVRLPSPSTDTAVTSKVLNAPAEDRAIAQSATFAPAHEVPLILGGHSFITQLGNDLPASEQDQYGIIETCLNCGIRWIDTTYQPERIRLGHMLQRLGRREEATILAWSFFKDFTSTEPVGGPECYRPQHIEIILEQLRTTYVNSLVVIPVKDPERNQEQIELTIGWRKKGYVRSLGLWVAELAATDFDQYRETNAFQFAVLPVNITTPCAAATLAACKKNGLETLATSPFFRGWELERMVTEGCARGYGDREVVLRQVADLMLRFSLFHSDVDRVIVGIRRFAWISRNVESASRGPLTTREYRWLRRLHAQAERSRWWQRLRHHLATPFSLRY